MSSKRRAPRPADPPADEPTSSVGVSTTSDSVLNKVIGRLRTLKGAIVAIAGVGAVLGGLAGYWNAYQAARSSTQSSAQLLALVDKGDAGPLSIVVLPFANLTGDPQQAYVADGITAAITADLSRIRSAFVVSASTAFAYKGKSTTLQEVGRDLGVRFALQGAVQRDGEKLRISAQLADTASSAQLWSEDFDGTRADLFALQDLVTTRIGNSIGREMVIVAARDSQVRKNEPTVADLLLRTSALGLMPNSPKRNEEMRALCRLALQKEPDNVRAMIGLAGALMGEAYNRSIVDPDAIERQLTEGRDWALKAKERDPGDARAYALLSKYSSTHADFEGARHAAERAVSLAPKNPGSLDTLADIYNEAGEPERAIELLTKAIQMDPRTVDASVLYNMGRAKFMVGDDDDAIKWMRSAFDKEPEFDDALAYLAMAHARRGDRAQAQEFRLALLREAPNFRLLQFDPPRAGFPPKYRKYWETKQLAAGRLAHLPE